MREDLKMPLAISDKFAMFDNNVMNLEAQISQLDDDSELTARPVQQPVSEQAPEQPSFEEFPNWSGGWDLCNLIWDTAHLHQYSFCLNSSDCSSLACWLYSCFSIIFWRTCSSRSCHWSFFSIFSKSRVWAEKDPCDSINSISWWYYLQFISSSAFSRYSRTSSLPSFAPDQPRSCSRRDPIFWSYATLWVDWPVVSYQYWVFWVYEIFHQDQSSQNTLDIKVLCQCSKWSRWTSRRSYGFLFWPRAIKEQTEILAIWSP